MAEAAPVPAGLPSPRSPTLSCAEMILPENSLRSFSPSPYVERPPSPPAFYAHSNRSTATIKLSSAPKARRGPSPQIKSPPLSSQSSRSTLRTMGDSDASSRMSGGPVREPHDALASSPTIADALQSHPPRTWEARQQRKLSHSSGSVHSDDLDNIQWQSFDGPGAFNDSGVVLEEEEEEEEEEKERGEEEEEGEGDEGDDEDDEDEEHHFPRPANGDDADNERWLDSQSDADDGDMYSSAALSRRAEMILANAKKRLNVMEGNLRGARQSLVVSPTFNPLKISSELSIQLAAARDRDRRLYAGLGPIPPRTRAYHSSPLSPNSSPSHYRGMSETSVPIPFSPSYTSRIPNKRASSAMGVGSGPWSPEGYGQGRFPIRESRSFEVMRDTRNGWAHDERDHSLRSYDSRGSMSSPNTLETLPEDDSPTLHRSASTTSDLRSQMLDLKGRISSLKQRAQEDHLRRRSLQSLRTPSPFTCAETWYTGTEAYRNGASPVTADAGVGVKTASPARKRQFEEGTGVSAPKVAPSSSSPSKVDSWKDGIHNAEQHEADDAVAGYYEEEEEEGGGEEEEEEEEGKDAQLTEDSTGEQYEVSNGGQGQSETDEDEFASADGDELGPAGDSVYEDAVYEMGVAERHEDRVDAFDYEHFFLHSAMGTYSSASRRSSSSSTDSVATTRPATAVHARAGSVDSTTKRMSMHQRNASVDSVSTVATFATAAEEQADSDDENGNEQMEQFSRQVMASQMAAPQPGVASPRSDSAINMGKANGSQASRGSSPGREVMMGLQTSKMYSILLECPGQGPRLALNEEEKRLMYSLAASLQQVCANLQSTSGDQYERKEWRRRLDEARRVLNGEEPEGQPF